MIKISGKLDNETLTTSLEVIFRSLFKDDVFQTKEVLP